MRRSPLPLAKPAGRFLPVLGLAVLFLPAVSPAQEEAAEEAAADAIEWSVEAPLAARSLLLGGAAADGRLWAAGEWGHILLSEDGGRSWVQQRVPTRANLTAIYFHDRDRGWAVGHDAVILRTTDGGTTWERVHWAPEEERPLLDVFFLDADRGMAIGAYSFYLVTEDGGASWTSWDFREVVEVMEGAAAPAAVPSAGDTGDEDLYAYDYGEDEGFGVDYHLNQMGRAGSGRLYIGGEAGTLYRSDDGGENWVLLPSPYEGSFFGVLPLAGDEVLVFGLRGHLFRSEDAGESWSPVETGTQAALTDGLELADGTVVLCGLSGTLLVSRDGGRSFDLYPRTDRQGFSSVLAAGDGALVLVGEFGVTRVELASLGEPETGE